MMDDRKERGKRSSPKQARGIETRAAILDAAAKLFAAQGYEQTTTHQVAGAAGISVGALYRYFTDKEAILGEIYESEVKGLRARILDGFSVVDVVTKDARDLVRDALERAFAIYAERPALWRVLVEQSRKVPELSRIRRRQEDELYATVQQILSSTPRVRLPDVEASAYLVSLFLENLIVDHVLYRREHARVADERIIGVAVDFIMHYLLDRQPAAAQT